MSSSDFWAIVFGSLGFTAMGMFFVVLSRLRAYWDDSSCNTSDTKKNLNNTWKKLKGDSRKLLLIALCMHVFFALIIYGIFYAPQLMSKINKGIDKIAGEPW